MAQPTPRTVTDAIHSNCTLVVDNYQAETEEMQKSLSSKIIVEQVETAMDHRQKVSYMLIVDYVNYDEGRHKHTRSTNLRLQQTPLVILIVIKCQLAQILHLQYS
jgi:hypothetical protein